MKILKMGAITLMACSLAGTGLGQAPAALSTTDLLKTLKDQRDQIQTAIAAYNASLKMVDDAVRKANPGFHVDQQSLVVVKDAPPAKVDPKK